MKNLIESVKLDYSIVESKDITKKIKTHRDYRKEGPWQATMSVMFDKLKSADVRQAKSIAKKYDDKYVLAVLAGFHNYQVENGGYAQYFDNGYASGYSSGAFGNHGDDLEMHHYLMELVKKHSKEIGSIAKSVLKNMASMDVYVEDCEDCGGSGVDGYEDEETGEYEESGCYSCNGSGESNYYVATGDDKGYYRISKQWKKALDDFYAVA